eukprot:5431238-Alexandrium_andersonii.AAC.1
MCIRDRAAVKCQDPDRPARLRDEVLGVLLRPARPEDAPHDAQAPQVAHRRWRLAGHLFEPLRERRRP